MSWQSRPLEECIERVKYDAKIPRSQFLDAGAYPVVSQEANFINGFWDNSADIFKIDRPVVIFGDHTQVLNMLTSIS
jgi:type I restriction enzyme, S subunit